jgi:hypothetical protein
VQLIHLTFKSYRLLFDNWKRRSKDVDISGVGVGVGAVIVIIYVVSYKMMFGKKIDMNKAQKVICRKPKFCGHVLCTLSRLTYTLGGQFYGHRSHPFF